MSPLPATVPTMMRTRIRASVRRRPVLTRREAEQRGLQLRLMSLLLQYPDAELVAASADLAEAARATGSAELAAFTDWFAAQEPDVLERHYVETFDLRRRSSLYLTYYLHGDTRRRGMALLTLAQTYKAAGWDTDGGELPDHLPVALEFAALAGAGAGEAPLRRHSRGLDLIHRALADADSPYRHVLAALLDLLPPATDEDLRAVAELAAQGPPAEDVGLTTPPAFEAPQGPR